MCINTEDFLSKLPLTVCMCWCLCVSSDEEEEEDLSGLHPGALLYRSAALQHFPVMADALAHGADVNWVNVAEESKTPLIQAATVVSVHVCRKCIPVCASVFTCAVCGQHYEPSRKSIMWAVHFWCNRK